MIKKRHMGTILILPAIIISFIFLSCRDNKNMVLHSPDGRYDFHLTADSILAYSVTWKDRTIIQNSVLGFKLSDNTCVAANVEIEKITETASDTVWKPVYGEQSQYRDNYNEMLVNFSKGSKLYALRIRAYNEGVAFRYEFNQLDSMKIADELTEFTFADNQTVWVSKKAQSVVTEMKLDQVSFDCERPFIANISDSVFLALGEAGLVDFARMKFRYIPGAGNRLKATLGTDAPTKEDKAVADQIYVPGGVYHTPWRYIMAGDSPSALLQNNFLILNLNEENQIKDPAWIKPGKIIRDVSLTTQGGIACVDFARKHNLSYIELDSGWYGAEWDSTSDATKVNVYRSPGPLDIHQVIDYAHQHGIKVLVYVNSLALKRQLDQMLPLYKEWGLSGIKYGFVNVASQKWETWLHESVRKAAAYEMMIDIHDEYRPTGYSRTYPNLMTQEGVHGDETSSTNDMVISTLFTRMIAGAADHTNCYFGKRVTEKMSSHASQLAKSVLIYSPLQWLYWYDRPIGSPIDKGGAGGEKSVIKEIPDLEFYDRVPTVWDQTKILGGYPGQWAAVAREKDSSWYIGAITGNMEKNFSLKLDFLDEEKDYDATIFSDDPGLKTETKVKIERIKVTRDSFIESHLLKQNGIAIIISPVQGKKRQTEVTMHEKEI